MLGFQSDLAGLLGAADAVAVPSTRPDPFPNAALEAAAAGVPVVAAAHGGLPEMLRDGETGLLVEPGDPAALARALRSLADDPDRARRLGAAAADGRRRALFRRADARGDPGAVRSPAGLARDDDAADHGGGPDAGREQHGDAAEAS